jgi:hypothetical protein
VRAGLQVGPFLAVLPALVVAIPVLMHRSELGRFAAAPLTIAHEAFVLAGALYVAALATPAILIFVGLRPGGLDAIRSGVPLLLLHHPTAARALLGFAVVLAVVVAFGAAVGVGATYIATMVNDRFCGRSFDLAGFVSIAIGAAVVGLEARCLREAYAAHAGRPSYFADGDRLAPVVIPPILIGGVLAVAGIVQAFSGIASTYGRIAESLGGGNFAAIVLRPNDVPELVRQRLRLIDDAIFLRLDHNADRYVVGFYGAGGTASSVTFATPAVEPEVVATCGRDLVAPHVAVRPLPSPSTTGQARSTGSAEFNTGTTQTEADWFVVANSTQTGPWSEAIAATADDVVSFRLFIHNNTCAENDATGNDRDRCPETAARNALVRVTFATDGLITAVIAAENARPISRTVRVAIPGGHQLQYLDGSTRHVMHPFSGRFVNVAETVVVRSDDGIGHGAHGLGDIWGSYSSSRYVLFQARVVGP